MGRGLKPSGSRFRAGNFRCFAGPKAAENAQASERGSHSEIGLPDPQRIEGPAAMTAPVLRISLEPGDPLGREAMDLLREMRAEALRRYGDILDASAPPPTNDPLVVRSVFLIARMDDQAIGCAALRPMELEIAEVRRMYVMPSARRRGIARRLLRELERRAVEFG